MVAAILLLFQRVVKVLRDPLSAGKHRSGGQPNSACLMTGRSTRQSGFERRWRYFSQYVGGVGQGPHLVRDEDQGSAIALPGSQEELL